MSFIYEYVLIHIVSQESRIATKVFREYPQARELWGIPHQTVFLNRVQEDAAHHAFIKPFQLIQGPPGLVNAVLILCCENKIPMTFVI